MSIEYYYPLMNLTVVGSATAKHFTRTLNNTDNLNFATETTPGKATEFYIQKITVTNKISDLAVKNKISNATHYLVIKHATNGNTTFNVVFPLKDDAKLSDHLNLTRMNGGLAKSIDNLIIAAQTGKTKVKFSLESVIDSMKSFNPKDYYYSALTTTTITPPTTTTTKTYVINDIIYVNKIPNNLFDPGSILIAPASTYTNNKTITKVIKTSDCLSALKLEISKDTLFTVKTKNGQERINYLNIIYGFSALLFVIFFYNIYYRYQKVNNAWQTLLMGIIFVLSLVIIPVATTAQIYNSKNAEALQHSVIFAKYLVVAFGFSIGIIFSTNLIGAWNYINNNGWWNSFTHFFGEILFESTRQIIFSSDKMKMGLTITSIIFSGYLGFLIYYIFVKI